MNRLENLRKIMKENKLDAIFISSFANIHYLSNHTSDEAYLFVTKDKSYIISDFRYREQIKEEVNKEFKYLELGKDGLLAILNPIIDKSIKTVGYEADYLTCSIFNILNKVKGIKLVVAPLTNLRYIKDKKELANIKKSSEIAEKAFNYIIKNVVKVGAREIDIANALEYKMKELGAIKPSFDTIVASSTRGALPHAKPTTNKLKAGDMVTIDFGAYYNYYCSDITRSFFVGNDKNKKLKEIYDIVLKAQELAIKEIKPGLKCSYIDKVARDYIASKGYGDNFGHSLGHGIGVEIHEEPRFSTKCDTILEEGMVITVEPGIYVAGLGGVRIEDDIVVTKNGCEVITKLPKKLMIIK